MESRVEILKKVMGDSEFVETIVAMEDPADVQKAFADKGVDFTIDEINMIARQAFGGDDELDENELEDVAGGILAEITIVCGVIALGANVMTEVNKSRKEQGKKTIW